MRIAGASLLVALLFSAACNDSFPVPPNIPASPSTITLTATKNTPLFSMFRDGPGAQWTALTNTAMTIDTIGSSFDTFAKCVASKQARMYGAYWCPHCLEQKEMFGASFHYVPYEECAIKGSSELATPCKMAGVKLFPSWQFGMEPPKEGVLSLEALADKTGCRLP